MLSRMISMAKMGGLALVMTAGLAAPAAATDFYDRLYANDALFCGDRLLTTNNTYKLTVSCNPGGTAGTVIQGASPGYPAPPTGWFSKGGVHAVMQGDGNFVTYNYFGSAVFASNTFVTGSFFQIQDDANLVVYTPWNTAVWGHW